MKDFIDAIYKIADKEFNLYECSECGILWQLSEGTPKENEMNYCPKCGAKITEDLEDEDDEQLKIMPVLR